MNSPQKPLWKKIISFSLPIIGLFFVVQSARSLYSLWRRGDIVEENTQLLHALEQEQATLKTQLSNSYSTAYIEQEARNKLGLVKPGETVVYVQKEASEEGIQTVRQSLKNQNFSGQADGQTTDNRGQTTENRKKKPFDQTQGKLENREKTVLQEWWEVFF